jgi:O-antigen/teichoic acid export membrane protein
LGYLFLGIYYNLTVWFKLTDKTFYGTIIALTGAVLTIILNYIFIPFAGYLGSSWATLACYFIMCVMCYSIGRKYYPIPYHITAGLAYIIFTVVIVYSVNAIVIRNHILAIGFHTTIIIIYLAVIYLIERRSLQQRVV